MNRIKFYLFSLLFSVILSETAFALIGHGIDSVVVRANQIPLLVNKMNNFAFTLKIYVNGDEEKVYLRNVRLSLDKPELLKKVKVSGLPFVDRWITADDDRLIYLTLGSAKPQKEMTIEGELKLSKGENLFFLSLIPDENVDLTKKISVTISGISGGNDWSFVPEHANGIFRMGKCVRAAGQENVDTYRIPGLVTSNKSTLIAVYDIRYNNNRDLQEDIDVGMSRSTDGGQTWQPMKVIMDMDSWGGLPDSRNGVGDPAVLVDRETNTIWVAALWVHGGFSSIQNNPAVQKGLIPNPDGSGSQVILVKSEDDGLTWSKPINITTQVKRPEWGRFLQGPGRGICLKNGTIVFASQYFDLNTKSSCSDIFYSTDHGKTWQTSLASVQGGSEAQVAELSDGRLMLNMRGNQKARLVVTSNDMGQTWQEHPTSAKALPEPGCMGSLIGADVLVGTKKQHVLFFSNPNHTGRRLNITIKASLDNGETWPAEFQALLYEPSNYGYSCLTLVGENTIGILYEGVRELYFQKVLISDIFGSIIK